jgi:hypothetical protein
MVSPVLRASAVAPSFPPSQDQRKPIDKALANWNQLLKAPSLQGREDNGNGSQQKGVFKGIGISNKLLRAFKGELKAVQKSVLASGLMMIVYDEPMKNAKRKGNEITAEFGEDSEFNIHKAWRVVCEVDNSDEINEMKMLRVEDSDGNAMAELNLGSSDITSSKSVSPQHRPAMQNQLLCAFTGETSTSRKHPSAPRKRPAAMENADEERPVGHGSKTRKAPASGLQMNANLIQANITSYVGAYFVQTLKDMLTTDLVTEDPTDAQKADNTYRASWVLPANKRFFAAFLQTAYQACKYHQIDITPEYSHTILQQAYHALIPMLGQQKEKDINASLTAAHQLTNDSQSALTMSMVMKELPLFTDISKVNEIFQRVVDRIKEINPNNQEIDPLQMWRHCVQRGTIDYLQENLPFDRDNPFLPYIDDDTDEKSSLLNSANAWDLMTQKVDQELTPELLMKLWDIHSKSGTLSNDNDEDIPMPRNNGNSTCLMMRDDDLGNAAHATLTKEGLEELREKITSKVIKKKYQTSIILGHKDDKKDSKEYNKRIVTLERSNTDTVKLQNLLKDIVTACNVQIAAAGEDKEALLVAEFALGMELTQYRLLPDQNITVAMSIINFLRLKNKQSVPFSFPNPDILDGYTLDQIVEVAKQEGV